MAPSSFPRTFSGTLMYEVSPRARSASRCSASRASRESTSSVTAGTIADRPRAHHFGGRESLVDAERGSGDPTRLAGSGR